MAVSARTLRIGLVAAAVLLLAIVAAFVGYAHRRAENYLASLPRRLGIDIEQETDNVTYSQSYKGRTVFTVHAAKQFQHANGKYTLRDVGIVLYGKTGDRADRIHGQQFEYDQKNGVLTAVGDVFIDLSSQAVGKSDAGKPADESRTIHVKTSGLVYLQKERIARTAAYTEFMAGGISGHSIGASYAGDTGVVILESEVHLSGVRNDKPMQLTSARAELDRLGDLIQMDAPRYIVEGEHGAQTAAADKAVAHLTPEGNPQRVEAAGHVRLSGEGRGVVTAERADLDLNAKGNPQAAHLWDGVAYSNDTALHQQRGVASDARLAFDPDARPAHALLTGAVDLEQTTAATRRSLRGDRVELVLGGGGKARSYLRAAEATVASPAGLADLHLVDVDAKGKHETDIRAARLTGRFGPGGVATGLDGQGTTRVERLLTLPAGTFGARDESAGDTLRIDFQPAAGSGSKLAIARADQRGNVVSEHESAPSKPGAARTLEHAKAAEVAYDADTDAVRMSGGVEASDAASLLLADHVTSDRATGQTVAEGGVRVSYAQADATNSQDAKRGEPVHVIGARAVLSKATGVTEFSAAPGGRVRMWQGGSAIESPLLDFNRATRQVVAKGGARAVLVGDKGDVVRVLGSSMTYSDSARTVDVAGPVRIEDVDGTTTANEGTLFLAPAVQPSTAASDAAPQQGMLAGKVERVIATGDVHVAQPGRNAGGERLLYTAADETFVLTGTKAVPPRVVDDAQGTVTGAQIRFRRGDRNVEVTGDGGRVTTVTRVKP